MLRTSIAAGLAGSLLLASAAFAQTPTATTDKADTASKADTATTASPSSFQGDWRASKVAGLSVYNDKNESIGSINDLLMDKSGSVKAAVISVGGFLGVGAKEVALAPNSFDVVPGQNGASDKLKLSATKDQLKDAQNFARYEPPRPTSTTGAGSSGAGGGMKK